MVKQRSVLWLPVLLSLAALACSVFSPGATVTPQPPTVALATDTAAPPPTGVPPTEAPSAEPPTEAPTSAPADATTTELAPAATDTVTAPAQQFIAYLDANRQLLVTDVTGGVLGGTTQYSRADVEGQILEYAWSPSGEFIAFVTVQNGDPYIWVVYAIGAGTPANIGNGTTLAWSPDSTHLAFLTEFKLWQIAWDGGTREQLTTNGEEWAWGRPVYTPAGDALVAGGAERINMGAQGNTAFWLYTIPLDGSGTLTQLPGLAAQVEGRLPMDLTYSPDGSKLAFSTSWHESACASRADYFVLNTDGSNQRSLVSPALAALQDLSNEIYFLGFDIAWTHPSDGLLQSGQVRNCGDFSGDLVGGPQLSVVRLDGTEQVVATGEFDSFSFDRTGTLIGTVARADLAAPGEVRLYDLGGNVVLTVSPGEMAAMQP